MTIIEEPRLAFIIRIWREMYEDRANAYSWRGYITHVPSGEKKYLVDLGDLSRFIEPYLFDIGVEPSKNDSVVLEQPESLPAEDEG